MANPFVPCRGLSSALRHGGEEERRRGDDGFQFPTELWIRCTHFWWWSLHQGSFTSQEEGLQKLWRYLEVPKPRAAHFEGQRYPHPSTHRVARHDLSSLSPPSALPGDLSLERRPFPTPLPIGGSIEKAPQ